MYLWHWPLQVWTGRYGWWDLSGLGTPARASILTALTVALAALSYHLVEKPVRLRRPLALPGSPPDARRGAAGTGCAVRDLEQRRRAERRRGARPGHADDRARRRLGSAAARARPRAGRRPLRLRRRLGDAGKLSGNRRRRRRRHRASRGAPARSCATDVPARQDAAIARYRPALVIWWSRYELADRVDTHGRPVRFASRAYWKLQEQAFATRTAALTRDGAIVVAVQVERSGLGMATRCTPQQRGPFLRRLITATAARDTWNVFLGSHRTGRVQVDQHRKPGLSRRGEPVQRSASGRLARPTRWDALRAGGRSGCRSGRDSPLARGRRTPTRSCRATSRLTSISERLNGYLRMRHRAAANTVEATRDGAIHGHDFRTSGAGRRRHRGSRVVDDRGRTCTRRDHRAEALGRERCPAPTRCSASSSASVRYQDLLKRNVKLVEASRSLPRLERRRATSGSGAPEVVLTKKSSTDPRS